MFRGIHHGALDARPNMDALSVGLPAGSQRRLCLTLETQDARYFGQASYLIGRRTAPEYRSLRLPTAHRRVLESVPIRDLSVIAFVADSCTAGEKVYLPLSLGTPRSADGSIVLLINSRTPGVNVRVFQEQEKRYADCAKDPTSERQVAFNVECRIEFPAGTRQTQLTVVRNRAEKVLAPETLTVYIPER